jgi:hypothetical protein
MFFAILSYPVRMPRSGTAVSRYTNSLLEEVHSSISIYENENVLS